MASADNSVASSGAAERRYAAFITYSHNDAKIAAWLHRALEAYRTPKGVALPDDLPSRDRRLAPIFRDREELSSSHDLSGAILDALASAHALIVVCSPAAASSRWVREEIKEYKRLHGEERVFALIVDGEDGAAPYFPDVLLQKISPGGENLGAAREPLAADIRPGKDGRKLAILKLAAGLLGARLDDLRQREHARERRRLAAVAAVSLAGMTVATGLATAAWVAREEAVRQRARAERETMTATRTAGFLVDLFKVADPGEARGREVTAKEILDKGVASIDASLVDEPAVQATLMQTMGEVYTSLGLYGDAAGLLDKTRAAQAAAGAAPIDLFRTENALATALYEKGDLDASREIFEKLVINADARLAAGEWDPAYAQAHAGLGELLFRNNEWEASEQRFQKAKTLLEANKLTETEEYADALSGLAGAYLFLDKLDAAERFFLEAEDLLSKIKGDDYYKLHIVKNNLAHVYYFRGDIDLAAGKMTEVYEAHRLYLGETHPETGIVGNNLARLKLEQGELDEARRLLARTIENERAAGRDKHFEFAYFANTMGLLDMEKASLSTAAALFAEGIAMITDESNPIYGEIRLNFGRAKCETGELEEGFALIGEGRAALPAVYEEDHWYYGVADEFEARCRLAAGESDRAIDLGEAAHRRLASALGDSHYFTKRAERFLAAARMYAQRAKPPQ